MHLDVGEDSDTQELDQLTRRLRTEIEEIDVESVHLVKGEVLPDGAKSVDPVTLGALAVVILPLVIPKLIDCLQAWLMRGENRTIKIKVQSENGVIVEVECSSKTSSSKLKSMLDTVNRSTTSSMKHA